MKIALTKAKNFWFRKIWLIGFIFFIYSYLYIAYLLPIDGFIFPETSSSKIFDRNGVLLYEILQQNKGRKSYIVYDKIPQMFINAIISAEDKNFFNHGAIDIKGTVRAIYQNIKEGRIVSGASTITQQLARNLLETNNERTALNKLMEIAYAVRFEHAYSKEEILEKYLNSVYFGNLAYGAGTASLEYFGRPLWDLDLAEMTLLAGLPQSPSYYNPFKNLTAAKKRQEYVLEKMLENAYITEKELEETKNEKLQFRLNRHEIKAPHFVNFVISELEKNFSQKNLLKGGLNIHTTIDYHKQNNIEKFLENHLKALAEENVTNGAIMAIDLADQSVIVYIGSKDYFDKKIEGANDMIQALRQPGSALKPFTYLLALKKGYTLATTFADIYTQFSTPLGPYTPRNYDLKYHGLVRLREALGSSFNIPAVKTLEYVGVNNLLDFLKTAGISTLDKSGDHYGLSLTLGGGEVRLFELTQAYSVLANNGVKKEIKFISRITDLNNNVIYEAPKKDGVQILGENGAKYAYLLQNTLSDPNARLKGFGEGNDLILYRQAAVKTGTTRNFDDNWTIGFTPQILMGVWVGNADSSPMQKVSGITGAAPLWNMGMEYLHKNLAEQKFMRPEGLVEKEICLLSGLLATPLCKETMVEIFIKGTEPTMKDNIYREIAIDKKSGLFWDAACKNAEKENKIYAFFPPELKNWAKENSFISPPEFNCLNRAVNSFFDGLPRNGLPKISSPNDNDAYSLSESIPDEFEKISFEVQYLQPPMEICFYLNEESLGCQRENILKWMPKKGDYSLFAELKYDSGNREPTKKINFSVK